MTAVAPRPAVNGTPYRSRGRVGVRLGVRVRVAVRVGIRVGGNIMFPAGVRYGFLVRVSVVSAGLAWGCVRVSVKVRIGVATVPIPYTNQTTHTFCM